MLVYFRTNGQKLARGDPWLEIWFCSEMKGLSGRGGWENIASKSWRTNRAQRGPCAVTERERERATGHMIIANITTQTFIENLPQRPQLRVQQLSVWKAERLNSSF